MQERPNTANEIADLYESHPVTVTDTVHHGWVWNVASDSISYGTDTIHREYIAHTSAVAILAMDAQDRVLLISQYRHPVRMRNWEIPAGLLDGGPDESPREAAVRELAEEADLQADTWHVLLDFWTTPGGSNESIRIFLARDLRPTAQPFARIHEEADIEHCWLDLDAAIDAVLDDRLHNPALLQALFAASESRRRGWRTLRDADAPWPTRSPELLPVPRALEGGGHA